MCAGVGRRVRPPFDDEWHAPMGTSRAVARIDELAEGATKRVVVDGTEVLLCTVDGKVYAIEDVCTHDGGALDQGLLEGDRIMCPRHGAYFDVRTGAALTLPAVIPVRTYAVRVEGDEVFVDLDEPA
jgi:3-phenylpropionate/trans-cinnamate dioxygenase ferredoxin subunit